MKIVWDEPKRLANIEDHGMDFADLDEAFFEDALVLPSYKRRRRGIGKYLDDVIAVIFATLGSEAVSVISMRPASKKERQLLPSARNKKGYTARDLRDVRDNPEWTAEDLAKAKPFAEIFPELAASIRKGRGPNKAPTKKLVSLRLSGQVIEAYKARGPGWQSRIDADLRRINKIK